MSTPAKLSCSVQPLSESPIQGFDNNDSSVNNENCESKM